MELTAAAESRLLELLDIDGRLILHGRALTGAGEIGLDITWRRIDELLDRRLQLAPPVEPAVWPRLYYLAHQDHSWGRT